MEIGTSTSENEKTDRVLLYHTITGGTKKVRSILREGIKPTAVLHQEDKIDWEWPGNKGSFVFLRQQPYGTGPKVVVEIPMDKVIVANELLHINNPTGWQSSFIPYRTWIESRDSLKNFEPEFLVLDTIPPNLIVAVIE